MTPEGVEGFGIVFSLVTGTAAGLLSLLTWEILKRSPFGRGVQILTVAMWLFILYHALILVMPEAVVLVGIVKSGLFTGIAIFILLLILNDHRLRHSMDPGGG